MPSWNGTIADREQAKAELKTKNSKIIYNVPEELKDSGAPLLIFNVSPFPYPRSMGSYGQFLIQACKDGQKYSAPVTIPRVIYDMYHESMFKMIATPDSGKKLAQDIVGIGPYHAPGEDLTKWGVFLAAGEKPTEAELAEANRKFDRTCDFLITEADGYWNQGPSEYRNVSDMHRFAAKRRGQTDKPWAREVQQLKSCPVCGNQIVPEAALCTHCKAVFNEAVVIANKVPGYEHLWAPKTKEGKAERS